MSTWSSYRRSNPLPKAGEVMIWCASAVVSKITAVGLVQEKITERFVPRRSVKP